ncbi:hypothetical protein BBD42_24880 [Paenibacillus sp. BIHB 4019]|uniref:ABC transporter substrate-binding protein n=1 Tax=Paenibacillus sp. BIHB 4019 TaxID=1870819 RepID=A0A1B2DNR2_9BACL|nr:extracellular solute-binding protein [Paenibacillus sp. BIHB 4019]ANY69355.1 hypothetical protein BBD42_24880 [Paenibacillus sp. BIHB 4019]
MKRRIFAMLLISVFFVPILGACSANSNDPKEADLLALAPTAKNAGTDNESDPFGKKLDIEVMAWWPIMVNPDDEVMKFISKKFNVNFKVTVADFQPNIDHFAMRIASGDYATYALVPWFWISDLGAQYKALIEDGVAVNVSELAEKHHFINILDQLKQAEELGTKPIYADENGDFYSIPRNDGYPNPGLFIRKDWLEQLNLEVPKSWEEVERVLKAFVKSDPDGNKNIGLTLNGADDLGTFDQILTTFTGVHSMGWTKQSGQWTHKVLMPEFKEGVKFLHRMYEEGLIDKEFGLLKASNAREKFTTGRAGMIIHNANGIDYKDFIQIPLQQYKPDADVTLAVPFPSGPKGQVRSSGSPYGSTGILLANENEEVSVRMLAILDWLLTEEGTNLSLNGVEGIHYEMQDGKVLYNEEKWQHDFGGIEHHFIRQLIFPGIAKEKSPRVLPILHDNYMDVIEHGVREEIIGLNTNNTAKYGPKTEEVYTKWISSFVTGDADIETDWDKFIGEWTSYGYEAIVNDIEAFEAANAK